MCVTTLMARMTSVSSGVAQFIVGMDTAERFMNQWKENRMITGSPLLDAVAFVVFGWVGAFLLLPIGQWIDYKKDCKKRGKAQADEIWKRKR